MVHLPAVVAVSASILLVVEISGDCFYSRCRYYAYTKVTKATVEIVSVRVRVSCVRAHVSPF